MTEAVSQTPARIVLGLLALALVGIFATINYFYQRDYEELLTSGEKTTGFITRTDCRNHGKVLYTYVVGGKEQYGSGNSCVPSCSSAAIGDSVTVTYSPKTPHKSECGSLVNAESRINGNYFALVVIAAGLVFAIFRITKTK